LSRTFSEQTSFKQFGIIKTLLNCFFRIASDAEETAIVLHFQRFKLPLEIRYDDIITPRGKRVVSSFKVDSPLLEALPFNFPLKRI
jgi:hypothetical protein